MLKDMGRRAAVERADTMRGGWMARAKGYHNTYTSARQRRQQKQKSNTLMGPTTCG